MTSTIFRTTGLLDLKHLKFISMGTQMYQFTEQFDDKNETSPNIITNILRSVIRFYYI